MKFFCSVLLIFFLVEFFAAAEKQDASIMLQRRFPSKILSFPTKIRSSDSLEFSAAQAESNVLTQNAV
jgi:hypothetical protein